MNTLKNNPRPRRWPWILLAVSLAFNLLIIGALGGMFLRQWQDGPAVFMPRGQGHMKGHGQRRHMLFGRPGELLATVRELLRELPPQRRRALREALKERAGTLRARTLEVAEVRLALAQALRAGDEGRVRALLERLRTVEAGARVAAVDLAAAAVAVLDEPERVRLGELLRQRARARFRLRRQSPGPGVQHE